MTRKISVSLNWEGPWEEPDDVPSQRAGIYMVIAGLKSSEDKWDISTYRLLDIGQSGETGVRLRDHERKKCWDRMKPSGSTLLYKFAATPSASYGEADRRIVECCLRAHTRPPCGTECNQGYRYEDWVTIDNKGRHSPLQVQYKCP